LAGEREAGAVPALQLSETDGATAWTNAISQEL
jgi:hypothetical protein